MGGGIYIQMLGGVNIVLNGSVYHGVMLHLYKGHDRDENMLVHDNISTTNILCKDIFSIISLWENYFVQ